MAAGPEFRLVIAVFAKAPVPGETKTRLIPRIGAQAAAQLQRDLIQRALLTATSSRAGSVELWCTPGTEHPFFMECAQRFGASLKLQCEGGLGDKMRDASTGVLKRAQGIVLIGTDCPALGEEDLRMSSEALARGCDAVFLPVEDGGYALIALSRTHSRLFENMPWGTDQVMAHTRERLRLLGWCWKELEMRWDVDRPRDYDRLVASGLLRASPLPK
ncbi:MAG: glycosyltransferase [Betaproteobacteria bacterium]|nr:glycosyltransferase [Betaproteobacteria bacterium]